MAEISINRKSDGLIYILIVDRNKKKSIEVSMSSGQFGYLITGMPNSDCSLKLIDLK